MHRIFPILSDADERRGDTVTVDAAMVTSELGAIAGNADLSKYIL